ncbi:hypothetical protein LSAT2_013956 [Lamellibrachia satsuma]|nr:hypothetical protein LSAT2_013956 [Lamellibrachia satsuma]
MLAEVYLCADTPRSSSLFSGQPVDIWEFMQRFDKVFVSVLTVKSYLDDKPPLTFVHLHINYKKLQQQELRMVDIERENRVMLDKMSYVYRTPPSLDNLVSEYNAYLLSVVKSLGRKKNERLFIRIAGANQWVFRRILEAKTNYSNKKFLLQWRKNKQAMEHFSQYPVTFGPLAEPMYTPTKKPDKRYRKAFRPPAYEKATCPKKQHLPSRAQKSELAVVDDIIRPRLVPKMTVKKPKPSSKPATKIRYAWMTTEERNEVIRASRAKKGEKYKDEGEEAKQQPKKNMFRALNKRSTVNSLIRTKLTPKVPHKVELRIPLTLPATNVLLKSYVKSSNEGNRKQNTKKTIRWATHKTKPEAKKNESVKNNKRKDGVETKTRNGEYNYSTGKIHEEKNGQTLFKKEKNGTSGYKDGSEETKDSEEDDEGKTDSEEDDEGKNDSEEDDEGKKASKEDDEGKNDSEEDDEGNNDSGEDDEGKTDSEEDDEGKNYSEEDDEGKNDFEEDDEGKNDFEDDTASELHEAKTHD